MTSTKLLAAGKVLRSEGDAVVFAPSQTTYELHLMPVGGPYEAPVNQRLECTIHGVARKVWTMPSGGAFIEPIRGQPRIIQGRIVHLDEKQMTVHAGVPVLVNLPTDDSSFDLVNGPLQVGAIVNVRLMPGTTLEPSVAA